MRTSLLLQPTTSQKIKVGIANMATDSSVQRLTFYEDLYLKPYKKSASMPHRRSTPSTPVLRKNTKRQASISEGQRTSWSKSPINNPLLDSPPSARTLTLAANARKTENQTCIEDSNNNDDYLRLSATAWVNSQPSPTTEHIYENHRYAQTRGHKSQSAADHVYEVIPANFTGFYQRTRYIADESNYIVAKPAAKPQELCKQQKNASSKTEQTATNLRAMRKFGRSVDSIRTVHDNKLRSQSTTLAPKLWMKSSTAKSPCLANSASCDNLLTDQPRLSTVGSPDKENRYPFTCVTKQTNGIQSTDSRQHLSPRPKQSVENLSQKGSNNSLYSTASLRATPSNKMQHSHRHSSSYSGFSSAYENMADIHKNLKPSRSEYVNVEEYLNQASDLNYADLDLTLPKPSQKLSVSNKHSRSASSSPTKLSGAQGDSNDDSVEYTLINIAATQAAGLACKEHQQDRQRRPHSGSSKTS